MNNSKLRELRDLLKIKVDDQPYVTYQLRLKEHLEKLRRKFDELFE